MLLIKRGDIFFADLNNNKTQIAGIRPVIILQNDIGNKYLSTTIIAPITSNIYKNNMPTHVYISKGHGLPVDGVILFEQITVIDVKRLKEKVWHADDSIMKQVDKALSIATAKSTKNIKMIQNNNESETENIIQLKLHNEYTIQYKDFYSSIKDIKEIKEMLKSSNYIGNKIKEWIISGFIGAIIGAGIAVFLALI